MIGSADIKSLSCERKHEGLHYLLDRYGHATLTPPGDVALA